MQSKRTENPYQFNQFNSFRRLRSIDSSWADILDCFACWQLWRRLRHDFAQPYLPYLTSIASSIDMICQYSIEQWLTKAELAGERSDYGIVIASIIEHKVAYVVGRHAAWAPRQGLWEPLGNWQLRFIKWQLYYNKRSAFQRCARFYTGFRPHFR
jgi:hypothetical protein